MMYVCVDLDDLISELLLIIRNIVSHVTYFRIGRSSNLPYITYITSEGIRKISLVIENEISTAVDINLI